MNRTSFAETSSMRRSASAITQPVVGDQVPLVALPTSRLPFETLSPWTGGTPASTPRPNNLRPTRPPYVPRATTPTPTYNPFAERIAGGAPLPPGGSPRSEVVEMDLIADPGLLEDRHDRVLLRRFDVQDQRVRERVNPKVPEHAALLVEQERVRGRPGREDLHVRRHDSVEERHTLRTREPDLRAVAPVDHPGLTPDRADLRVDRAVGRLDQPPRFGAEDRAFQIVVAPKPT